jgi:histidyl-tRNA synthetase
MSNQIPQTLKGFRDFLPAEKRRRDIVEHTIVAVFERFGFEPLETPTLEYASLLLGKYGDEADKLVYTFEDKGDRRVGLRYDQTVPTARVLAQYQHLLPKYFRRYQLQNVFRADKPQKGRYREFRQCDIDIFGSTSPLADAEIVACAYFAYKNVGFSEIVININDRQVLMDTLSPFATDTVSVGSIITTIDKLDKISETDAVAELVAKGLDATAAQQAITQLQQAKPSENLQKILTMVEKLGVPTAEIKFNPRIARGLDYYTGMIFEVTIPGFTAGSVGGGGRYDNLIGDLSGVTMPAVGMAFGFDRTVEAAVELGLVAEHQTRTQVLVALFDESTAAASLQVANKLRQAGIATEVYPSFDKLGKQFKLADQKLIPWVVIVGENEIANNTVSAKNMASGEQITENLETLITRFS